MNKLLRLLRRIHKQLDKIDRHPCPVCDRIVPHGHMGWGLDACDACDECKAAGYGVGIYWRGKRRVVSG